MSTVQPTVVLVHGAWANSAAWSDVIARLQHDGFPVLAPPTPLRTLSGDAAHLSAFLENIDSAVILVGHSYGGAVITNAATTNVKALVYINAFAPDNGENVLQLSGEGSALANPDLTKVFSTVPGNTAPTPTTDLYILPEVFADAIANDLPAQQTAVLAATQSPVTLAAVSEASAEPAWKSIPSWYLLGTLDNAIPKGQQFVMAERAKSQVVEVAGSHLAMVSHPGAVAQLIEEAARATD